MFYRFELNGNSEFATLHVDQRLTPTSAKYSLNTDGTRKAGAIEQQIIRVGTQAHGVARVESVDAYSICIICAYTIDRKVILDNLVRVLQREMSWDRSAWVKGPDVTHNF